MVPAAILARSQSDRANICFKSNTGCEWPGNERLMNLGAMSANSLDQSHNSNVQTMSTMQDMLLSRKDRFHLQKQSDLKFAYLPDYARQRGCKCSSITMLLRRGFYTIDKLIFLRSTMRQYHRLCFAILGAVWIVVALNVPAAATGIPVTFGLRSC